MKKFLAILLIAIVACSTVPEENLPETIKNRLDKLLKSFKKAVEALKDSGLLSKIGEFLKSLGLVVPKELCLKVFDEELCDEFLGNLPQKDGEVVLKFPWVVLLYGIEIVVDAVSLAEAIMKAKEMLGF